jgi:threonine/homoserine/homoserine lactone efflux protein
VPVGAAVLILLSAHPKSAGLAFLGGWVFGIALAVTAFTLLSSFIPETDPDASRPILGTIKIILGLAFLVLAVRLWRKNLRRVQANAPRWLDAISHTTAARALLIGFVLAAFNPVDTLMAIAAGVLLGPSGLSGAAITGEVVLFVVIGASTVAIPVLAYVAAPRAIAPRLEHMHDWLLRYNGTITAVLLLVIGVALVGKGIESF